ncbi:DUF2085 domain-containing protein [Fusobacterium varium]|uniref:DUF2085 domain-containing protein n=1 Tax=Fusobacterium varium TaxID=856 RepID=UPI0022E27EA1|nr:DUF2085 domain-containing protein [Fusobacterium varium]MCF0170040.1 DUF2085 domain-containing protein [Fusobacterium varium]
MNKIERFLKILFMCHSRPDRSFYFNGKQFPICARCTGVLLGWIIGIIYCILLEVPRGWVTVLILIPLMVDGGTQALGKRESNNILRCVTGILFGMGAIFIFLYFHRLMLKLAIIFLKRYIFINK